VLRRDAVALRQFAEGISLCIEQGFGFAGREKRRGILEAEFVCADGREVMGIDNVQFGMTGNRQF